MERQLLRRARLVDGTGAPGRRADVLVRDGRIEAVGTDLGRERGTPEIDLSGLVLAPGFIDPHTHYDAQVFWDPDLTPSSWHGVTTVVIGNCGFGVAPTRAADRATAMRVLENVEGMPYAALERGIDWSFETFPEYLDRVEALPLRIHVAAMIGHTPLRTFAMGPEGGEREARPEEISVMRELVAEALDAGAVGLSSSRSTSHVGAFGRPVASRGAALAEIAELAAPMTERGRGVFEATWGPDLHVDGFAELADRIGRPVTWAAILAERRRPGEAKRLAERSARLSDRVFPQISCRELVVEIAPSDPFPFATAPAFAEVLGVPHAERASFYRRAEWRERARRGLEELWGPVLDSAVVVASASRPDLADGPRLAELARDGGSHPIDLFSDLALADGLATRFRVPMLNDDEEQIAGLLAMPQLLLGLSDAGAHTSQLCDASYATHLLGHWWREKGALPLEQAVWRLTGQPAAVFGLAARGRIAPGFAADLVAFDPERVASAPLERVHDFPGGCDRLVARSLGIEHVWVDGRAIRRDGRDIQGVAPGRLLRRGGA